ADGAAQPGTAGEHPVRAGVCRQLIEDEAIRAADDLLQARGKSGGQAAGQGAVVDDLALSRTARRIQFHVPRHRVQGDVTPRICRQRTAGDAALGDRHVLPVVLQGDPVDARINRTIQYPRRTAETLGEVQVTGLVAVQDQLVLADFHPAQVEAGILGKVRTDALPGVAREQGEAIRAVTRDLDTVAAVRGETDGGRVNWLAGGGSRRDGIVTERDLGRIEQLGLRWSVLQDAALHQSIKQHVASYPIKVELHTG